MTCELPACRQRGQLRLRMRIHMMDEMYKLVKPRFSRVGGSTRHFYFPVIVWAMEAQACSNLLQAFVAVNAWLRTVYGWAQRQLKLDWVLW